MNRNVGNTLRYAVPSGKLSAVNFCARVGISRSTLQVYKKKGIVTPEVIKVGNIVMYIYDDSNIIQVRNYQNGR